MLAEKSGKTGDWKTVFGTDAEECFMAYFFAKAVEKITVAGQKEYALPCYTNAWLRQYPWYTGSYPSGGPVREVQWIWKPGRVMNGDEKMSLQFGDMPTCYVVEVYKY